MSSPESSTIDNGTAADADTEAVAGTGSSCWMKRTSSSELSNTTTGVAGLAVVIARDTRRSDAGICWIIAGGVVRIGAGVLTT